MIKTDFQEELMKVQRERSNTPITDETIMESMKILHNVVILTFNDLDISALTRMLSTYLIHSEDYDKEVIAEKANEFIILAEYIKANKRELSVIDDAFTDFEEGVNEERMTA